LKILREQKSDWKMFGLKFRRKETALTR